MLNDLVQLRRILGRIEELTERKPTAKPPTKDAPAEGIPVPTPSAATNEDLLYLITDAQERVERSLSAARSTHELRLLMSKLDAPVNPLTWGVAWFRSTMPSWNASTEAALLAWAKVMEDPRCHTDDPLECISLVRLVLDANQRGRASFLLQALAEAQQRR